MKPILPMKWAALLGVSALIACGADSAPEGAQQPDDWPLTTDAVDAGSATGPKRHYVLLRSYSSDATYLGGTALNDELDELTEAGDEFKKNTGGVIFRVYWSDLQQDEDPPKAFPVVRQVVNSMRDAKQKVFVQIQLHSFQKGKHVVPRTLLGKDCGNGTTSCWEHESDDGFDTRFWGKEKMRLEDKTEQTLNEAFAKFVTAMGAWKKTLPEAEQNTFAGIILPETACGGCVEEGVVPKDWANDYAAAIRAQITATRAAFPGVPVFQYINFLSSTVPNDVEHNLLCDIAEHARSKRVGLGAPDGRYWDKAAGTSLACPRNADHRYDPPGFSVLRAYQRYVPIHVQQQQADLEFPQSLAKDLEAVGPNGIGADFVGWLNNSHTPVTPLQCGKLAFNIGNVYTALAAGKDPVRASLPVDIWKTDDTGCKTTTP